MRNQNLNVGEKLSCKKDYINNKISIRKDEEYEISDIAINDSSLIDGDENVIYYYYILDDNNSKIEIRNDEDIETYFYTKKDIRKMKLKKLNNEKSKY